MIYDQDVPNEIPFFYVCVSSTQSNRDLAYTGEAFCFKMFPIPFQAVTMDLIPFKT